jgi:anti-sigma-K factor RskA
MNDNVTPDDWESQLIDYTMGVMGAEDAAAFEAGMEECRRNLQMARDYGVVTGWMGLAASPGEPPQGHKSRLMARVQSTPQALAASPAGAAVPAAPRAVAPQPAPAAPTTPAASSPQADGKVTDLGEYKARRRSPGWMPVALAAAGVVILLMGGWVWNLVNGVNIPPGYKTVSLAAQKGYEKVTAVAFYDPQKTNALLVANGLPTLPPGKAYELWFLKGQGNPDPAGTFSADPSGNATHAASSTQTMAAYSGFAVSEEPASGSSTPTGPIIVAGTYP